MFSVFFYLALVAGIAGQCLDGHPNCPGWASNGFCTNPFYASLQSTCPLSCGICNQPCADSNVANCITWVVNGFCSPNSIYTAAQKRQYCAASCGLCP